MSETPDGMNGADQTRPSRAPLRQNVLFVVVVVAIGYLSLVPIVYLTWGTLADNGGWSLAAFERAYQAAGLFDLIYNSTVFTIGATILSVVLGTALAFLTERTDVPFKKLVYAAALVPLVIPGILYTIAWIFLASPEMGILNQGIDAIFGARPLNVFTMPGMIIVQALDSVPLVFLLMAASFRSSDPSLEESALASGARLRSVIWRISLPLAKPGMLAAALIMAVRNLESFETPALLGIPSRIWVFTSRIWQAMSEYPQDIGQAGAFSLSLVALISIGIWAYSRLSRQAKRFQTITGKGYRARSLPLGRLRRPIAAAMGLYFVVTIILPILVLFYFSTQSFLGGLSWDRILGANFENYQFILQNDTTVRAFRNSILLSIGAATFVIFLTAVASWLVVRTKVRGRFLIDVIAFLPFILPGLVIGVAILFVYLRAPVPIYGTLWILLIAYWTKGLPYGMRFVSVSMYQIGSELEESGRVSGATWWQTFRRITLPLLVPGMLAGWVYIVLITSRDLSSSLLLYSPGNEVLAVMIWQLYTNGRFAELSALGMMMIVLMTAVVYVAHRFGVRFGVHR